MSQRPLWRAAAMTARPIGEATELPVASSPRLPPRSTMTDTAICGLGTGPNASYQVP